mgnify:CR=1 FL=1
MLTKEERAAIAERLNKCNDVCVYDLYKAVFGKEAQDITPYREDVDTILRRLIDLCDTSNMVELPLDKDGVPFKIGDTVYDPNNKQYKVNGYIFVNGCWKIIVAFSSESSFASIYANDLTHKKPVTVASLVDDIKRVANQGRVDRKVYEELFRIAWALESLGDSDD